ncbi:MAG: ATP-binding protein, partial [bacterium]
VLITAKDNMDRLTRIINNLLDISKIEAGKTELMKGLIEITSLIKKVATSFESNAKEKGLELRVSLPKEGIEIYADADKMIQVFINLVANAVKFTEKGYIEISVEEKEEIVECSVADTGIGISKDDLPKLFSKFQQFGRVPGSGEKGTGLGLSIAKGIVEMHNGRIRVESESGKGTKFTFTVPKYTTGYVFKEYARSGIKKASEGGLKMSLILISIAGFNKLKEKLTSKKMRSILEDIGGILKGTLRQKADIIFKDSEELIVLIDCNKESALRVEGRLEQAVEGYLNSRNLADEFKLNLGCSTYPDDGGNEEELIKKAGGKYAKENFSG